MEIIVVGLGGKAVARVFSALGAHAVYVAAVSAHTADDTYWEEVDLLYVMKGAVSDSVKEMMRLARVYGTFVLLCTEIGMEEKIDNVDFLVLDSKNSDDVLMLNGVKVCMYPSARGVHVQSARWNGTILMAGADKAEVAIIVFVDQLLQGGNFETALQTAENICTEN